ncbi:MAG: glutamate-1-semialdehyde 2,1-aminomutase [Parachlamydiaceae bacterium]|nr:glutamate-1-semialdehyde 2,1-aminomutase [Parachlamydiaceae bacterium]
MPPRPLSTAIYQEMCQVIPGGVNSPVRSCASMGQLPMVVARGAGDQVFDVDNNAYIDFCGSWGALIHGHAHPVIVEAVQKRVAMGSSFGITSAIEGELAKKVVSLMPSLEKIRFVSSGTEATMSAARLARGFTKREFLVKFSGNYHGHADFFLIQAGSGVLELAQSSSAGIPATIVKHTFSLPYNDINTCISTLNDPRWRDQIAAVIIEPIAGNMGVVEATKEFLQMLREETKKIGALLIFDEVISGFRVALGGAQALNHIVPDITCLGKIIGGGFPAAAFGGRREIMDQLAPLGPVYQAGTLSGNPVAMEAGLQALKLLEQSGFYETLAKKTNLLTDPLREWISAHQANACVQQVGSMFTLFFGCTRIGSMEEAQHADVKRYAHFFRHLFEHGVYIPPAQHEAWFVSSAHETQHLEKTRDLILKYFEEHLG